MEVDWTVLEQVLLFLVSGGAVFVVNYALAYLVENFEFWHKLPSWLKFLIPIVASVLLAFGAQQLLLYPDIIAAIQPVWALIVTIVLAWLGSQRGYISAKAANYGAEKRIK
jgi:uncharacterized membrane protein